MFACIWQQSPTQPGTVLYYDCIQMTTDRSEVISTSFKRQLSSEQNHGRKCFFDTTDRQNETHKKAKEELASHESNNKYSNHGITRSVSGCVCRRSLTHTQLDFIKGVHFKETKETFLYTLSKATSTFEENMLICQQKPSHILNDQTHQNIDIKFLTCAELAAYITTYPNTEEEGVLIIDCGSPLRHTDKRIQGSVLLNVNDKISRKRLSTRGLKNFLDNKQRDCFDKNNIVILYDDYIRPSSCANASLSLPISSSVKCVYDEVKRYNAHKTVLVLESPFNEFYQHYSFLCYVSMSTDEDLSDQSPLTSVQPDIDTYPMSEILSGLYLGNSRDAENLDALKQNEITVVINISTSIPCFFEEQTNIEYLRLPCHDSCHQNIRQYFETTFEYIHRQLLLHKNVLVHCQGGVSRSPSFVIGYLMKYHSKTLNEAHSHVKTARTIVNPNLNFLGQLVEYEQSLSSMIS